MPRATNRPAARARRRKTMKLAKGYFGRRKNVWTVVKNAVEKALQYAYTHRRTKKREFRRLWIARINAAVRMHDLNYSKFINLLAKKDIKLNRKVLADLAMNDEKAFEAIIKAIK